LLERYANIITHANILTQTHKQATDFFVNEKHLGFVAFDAEQNMLVYSYCPQERETQGGRVLVKHADFSVGCFVTTTLLLRCYERLAPMTPLEPAGRHLLMYGSKEGAVGLVLPIAESLYRRLHMLQSRLTTGLQHRAGLNPRGYRAVSRVDRHGARRNVLDGNLLSLFFSLGLVEQGEFAKRIGTTSEQIISDLCAIAEARACL